MANQLPLIPLPMSRFVELSPAFHTQIRPQGKTKRCYNFILAKAQTHNLPITTYNVQPFNQFTFHDNSYTSRIILSLHMVLHII